MSLHADLTQEANEKLQRQRRLQSVSSLFIAALVIGLTLLLLGIMMLPAILKETPDINVVYVPSAQDVPEELTKPVEQISRNPQAAPAAANVRVIAAAAPSAISIPVPEVSVDTDFTDFSVGIDDFGAGMGGTGTGGTGTGSPFGAAEAKNHALSGTFYDFKQDARGRAVTYDVANLSNFSDRAARAQRSRFSPASLRNYFRAEKKLYLTSLAVPFGEASNGPHFFGVSDKVKPSGWFVHYVGTIKAPEDGEFRFVGLGDDYLSVYLNNRPQLIAAWPGIQEGVRGTWNSKGPNNHISPFNGQPLVYGDWILMRKGQEFQMDLAIGEAPGGKVGFILMVEKRGETYQKGPNGRPIIPVFTLEPFSEERRNEIRQQFGGFAFEWEKVPVFGKF